MHPEIPERIGPYELRDMLSEGVMGRVYRAKQREPVRRTVALKVLNVGQFSEQSRARFEIEMKALSPFCGRYHPD